MILRSVQSSLHKNRKNKSNDLNIDKKFYLFVNRTWFFFRICFLFDSHQILSHFLYLFFFLCSVYLFCLFFCCFNFSGFSFCFLLLVQCEINVELENLTRQNLALEKREDSWSARWGFACSKEALGWGYWRWTDALLHPSRLLDTLNHLVTVVVHVDVPVVEAVAPTWQVSPMERHQPMRRGMPEKRPGLVWGRALAKMG